MAQQYDAVAEQYQRTKQAPLRTHVEVFTLMQLIGDATGSVVLDLACGEGFYSRRVKQSGAATVIGVDISTQMIQLANQQERISPLGISYVCANVADLDLPERFDIAVAGYLLHYARDERELREMARRVSAHLKPGGRFVGLNDNPVQLLENYAGYDQYGFNKTAVGPLVNGSEIIYWFVSGRTQFQIEAHYFDATTYERALRDAGFIDVAWKPLQLDPAGVEAFGQDYWREYMSNPPIVGFECRLPR